MPVHGSMVPVQVEGSDEQYQQVEIDFLRKKFDFFPLLFDNIMIRHAPLNHI
ncbi:unnamed protein product [Camellia sinensis]